MIARHRWLGGDANGSHAITQFQTAPGGIIGIQTFGQLIHFHPHLHGLVTDGAFTADGGRRSQRIAGRRVRFVHFTNDVVLDIRYGIPNRG